MIGIFFIIVGIGAALIIGALQRRALRLRSVCRGLLITYAVFVLALVSGELYFRYAYAESDGLPTLATQNWLARYWHENALGYRDREWTAADLAGKTTVLTIGDSFTAGWGIDDPANRWSGVLQTRLGDDYAVINLGDPGAALPRILENLRAYPLQTPDWVIWQYTLNDIDDAALSIGLDPGLNPLAGMPSWAQDSYLGNFVYWRLAGRSIRGTDRYIDWLFSMFDHSVVWEIHAAQLNAGIDQIEAMGANFGVIIFPDMAMPFESIPYVDRVASVFEARGYGDRVIRLFDQAAAMPLAERIVSARDAHPGVAFSRVVGELIAAQWFAPIQPVASAP